MGSYTTGTPYTIFESSDLSDIFTADIMLPSQHSDLRRAVGRSPEHRLYLTILQDAIECWLKGGDPRLNRQAHARVEEAACWIWPPLRDAFAGTVTFQMCCDVLGFSPDWLRSRLLAVVRPVKIARLRPKVSMEKRELGAKVSHKSATRTDAIMVAQGAKRSITPETGLLTQLALNF